MIPGRGDVLLECGWSNPDTLAAAWTIAKGAGGTLGYRLVGDVMEFTVSFKAVAPVQTTRGGVLTDRVAPGHRVSVVFRFGVTECPRATPDERARIDSVCEEGLT